MKKLLIFLLISFGVLLADTRVYHSKVDVIRSEALNKLSLKHI